MKRRMHMLLIVPASALLVGCAANGSDAAQSISDFLQEFARQVAAAFLL